MPPYKRKANGQLTNMAKRRKRLNKKAPIKSRVNKILRFINQNKPEIKLAKYTSGASFNSGDIKSWNIAHYMLGQGTGETQFIGKKVNLKYLTLKYYADNSAISGGVAPLGGSGSVDTIWRVSIIACKTFKTTSNLDASEIYDSSFTDNNTYNAMYDSDKVKILATKKMRFTPHLAATSTGLSGPPMVRYGAINFRFNRTLEFRDLATSKELKNWNYYILIQTNSQTLGGGNSPSMTKTGDIGFKAKLTFSDP